MNQNEILKGYSIIRDDCDEFTIHCKHLVEQLLNNTGIELLPITSRTKTVDSLKKTLSLSDEKYNNLSDITDLSGIRVITYFSDDVDKVRNIIEQNFNVDPDKSADKRKLLDPDRFGYLSIKLICRISPGRLNLPEYKRFYGRVVEIQIRSVLQHAWAEIEHDRGYKTLGSIPAQTRRRFSRLAGLLEIADDEFIGIRDELLAYERNLEKQILSNPSDVLIDRVSLMTLTKINMEIRELDNTLADYLKIGIEDIPIDYADARVKELQYFGFNTIEDIRLAIKDRHKTIIKLFKIRAKVPTVDTLYRGVTLYYLAQILIAEKGDDKTVAKGLVDLKIGTPSEAPELSRILIAATRTTN